MLNDERPKTLRELLQSGELQLRTSEEAAQTAREDDDAVFAWVQESMSDDQLGLRREGRPLKASPKPPTKVKSLRLEIRMWDLIDRYVELKGLSVNRFIEESLLMRFGKIPSNCVLVDEMQTAQSWDSGKEGW